jgi:hypothetical protein
MGTSNNLYVWDTHGYTQQYVCLGLYAWDLHMGTPNNIYAWDLHKDTWRWRQPQPDHRKTPRHSRGLRWSCSSSSSSSAPAGLGIRPMSRGEWEPWWLSAPGWTSTTPKRPAGWAGWHEPAVRHPAWYTQSFLEVNLKCCEAYALIFNSIQFNSIFLYCHS